MPPVKVVDGYDVLIVGSGFGGSVAALRLAEKGYRVAVLEAGKRFATEDFPLTNWNLRRSVWMPKLFCHGILRLTLLSDVLVGSGAGVGGGSLVCANTLPVPRADVFRHTEWPSGRDWEEALAPHYVTAKRMLGAATNPRLTEADRVLRECAEEIGKGGTFRRTDVAVFFGEPGEEVPDPYFGGEGPARSGCVFCGGCMVGCRHNAKNTLDKNYLYLAQKRGARIFPETKVDALRQENDGRYTLTSVRSTAVLAETGKSGAPHGHPGRGRSRHGRPPFACTRTRVPAGTFASARPARSHEQRGDRRGNLAQQDGRFHGGRRDHVRH